MRSVSISLKIFLISTLILVSSILIISETGYHNAQSVFKNVEENQLKLIKDIKVAQIEQLYRNHFLAVSSLSKMPEINTLFNLLNSFYEEKQDSFPKDSLQKIYEKYALPIDKFVKNQTYTNYYLINNTNSQILYNLKHDNSIGIKLRDNDSELILKQIWRKVIKERKIIITDYYPEKDDSSRFISYTACPVISETGNNFAVLILEIPYSTFNNILQDYSGLGETGEFIIIGKDSIVRNNLRFADTSAYKFSIPLQKYFTNTKTINEIKDYRNTNVISSESKLNIPSLDWHLIVKKDIDEIFSAQQILKERLIFISLILIIFLSILLAIMINYITNPIRILNEKMKILKLGILTNKISKLVWKDEISEIIQSYNTHVENLSRISEVANRISKGDVNIEFEKFGDNNEMGQSIFKLSENIKTAKIEETKRKTEDKHRDWAANGIAKFTAILHQERGDMHDLGYSVIENLVNYVEANQGGIFIIMTDDDNKLYFEMIGSYAYNRKKFIKNRIELKEGYIGACAIEKETILMTDIPDNYVNITSGLGQENPKCLLLVPLKFNEEVVGVFEIASFTIIEDYKIKFIETIAESTANILSSVRNRIQTEKLLYESDSQRNQLKQQEEEMRQNLEELQATQEDFSRKQKANHNLIDAINKSLFIVEYNLSRKMITANDNYLNLLNFEAIHIINHSHSNNLVFVDKYTSEEGYIHFWKDLNEGKIISLISKITISDNLMQKDVFLKETYVPIKNENKEITKFLKFAINITDLIS